MSNYPIFKDRVVEYPHRYKDQNNNELTLTQNPGIVTEVGTPINAANMNQIYSHMAESVEKIETGLGRYQSEFGFDNGNEFDLNKELVTVLQQSQNAYYECNTAQGSGEELEAIMTNTIHSIKSVSVFVRNVVDGNGNLVVTIYDKTDNIELGSSVMVGANVSGGKFNKFIFDEPVKITSGNVIQIRFLGTGSFSANLYYYNSDNQPNAFRITTTDGWANVNNYINNDLAFEIEYYKKTTQGTATKTISPDNIHKWGNLKVTTEDLGSNNSASMDIKDNTGATTLLTENLTNGENLIDLSAINVAQYKKIQIIFNLSRNETTDPTPKLIGFSCTWEGDVDNVWKKIDKITLDENTAQLDVSVPNTINEVRIIGENIKYSESSTREDLRMILNDDTSNNNYRIKYIKGTTINELFRKEYAIIGNEWINNYQPANMDITISNIKNSPVKLIKYICSNNNLGNDVVQFGFGAYDGNSDITKISFFVGRSGSSISALSTFEIWGR